MEVFISGSTNPKKKLMAVFYKDGKKKKTTHFGANGMSDYTIHKDPERKKRWEARHRARENWNAPMTAGALSKHILWNKTSREASIRDYLKRFNLKRIKSLK